METKQEQQRCPKCDALYGHNLTCPDMPTEKKAEMAEVFQGLWIAQCQKRGELVGNKNKEIEFWQGKFRTVKHENNQLRNKLYRKNKAEDTSFKKTV